MNTLPRNVGSPVPAEPGQPSGHRAMAPTGIGLSLAFQAQSFALAHPCDARFRAANASERPWCTAKPVPHAADCAEHILVILGKPTEEDCS